MRVPTRTLAFVTASLLSFLAYYESSGKIINTVYADKLAGGLPTVCSGITKYSYTKRPIIVGEYWTDAECKEAEEYVVRDIQIKLSRCMPYSTQEAFEAITSLSYNMGVDRVCREARAVVLINAGQMEEGCRAIAFGVDGRKVWTTVNGVYYEGLHKRRLGEMHTCLKGVKK